jgi:hypothetical protein
MSKDVLGTRGLLEGEVEYGRAGIFAALTQNRRFVRSVTDFLVLHKKRGWDHLPVMHERRERRYSEEV